MKSFYGPFFAAILLSVVQTQAQHHSGNAQQLQKYVSDELFEHESTHDVSGKWVGTEIQYDETGSFIKVKFDIVFEFMQEGNRVTGTSYIKDKLHEDVGYMNIRGYVIGDKLHFEEYELTAQKWETPNRVWCFRTGELNIVKRGRKLQLSGDYDAYAAYDYRPCRDYCFTVVEKDATEETRPEPPAFKFDEEDAENMISVAPSPFRDETRISYSLDKQSNVRLEVFDLNGRLVSTIVSGTQAAGTHVAQFQGSGNPPGSYLVRLLIDDRMFTEQVVLMR
jgi:hypothetical protein